MNEFDGPTAVKTPPIQAALQELGMQVDRIEKTAHVLEQRLGAALGPVNTEADIRVGTADQDESSQLAHNLNQLNMRASQVARFLEGLVRRIEL